MTAPVNDDFADAIVLTPAGGVESVTVIDATTEVGEPEVTDFFSRSVWYAWTPAAGPVRVRFDPGTYTAEAWTGASVGALTRVTGEDPFLGHHRIEWEADGTTTYYVQVKHYTNAGPFDMTYGPYTKTANDDIADAEELDPDGGSFVFDNTNAGLQFGEGPRGDSVSLWYKVTPTGDAVYAFDVSTSPNAATMYPRLVLYDAADLSLPDAPGSAVDPVGNYAPRLVVQLQAGHTYYLRTDANIPHDDNVLVWGAVTPPPGDAFDNAVALTPPTGGTLAFDNSNATRQVVDDEWDWTGNGTLWFSYTTSTPGLVTVSTAATPSEDESGADTYLAVWADATLVPTNDDPPNADFDDGDTTSAATVTFEALAGVEYLIQLSAYDTIPDGVLTWTGPTPPDSGGIGGGIGDASVAVDYVYELIDSDGTPLGDLPLAGPSFTRVLSRFGTMPCTLPLTHPIARRSLLDRVGVELVVSRNNLNVWNGPITFLQRDKRAQLVTIRASELTWWFYNARLETDYSATSEDVFNIVRDLIDIALAKTGGSRFSFTVSSGLAGITKTVDYKGAFRYSIGQLIEDLSKDPIDGFDFRLDVFGTCAADLTRKLTLGAPMLGNTIVKHKLEAGAGMHNLVETLDLERGGNRVHLLPGIGDTLTLTNSGSLGAGHPSIEYVLNRPDLDSAQDPAPGVVQELRRRAQPPVRALSGTYVPRAAVPYGWCNLGDLIGVLDPDMQIDATRRVQQIETTPPNKTSNETVALALALPLDELGT